jgi:hypothetical protein
MTSGAFGCAFNGKKLPKTGTTAAAMVFSRLRTAIDRVSGGNAILFSSFSTVSRALNVEVR